MAGSGEELLSQRTTEVGFRDRHSSELWTTLYESHPMAQTGVSFFSCLMPIERRE